MDAEALRGLEILPLWPEGPPTTIPDVGEESVFHGFGGTSVGTHMLRNITEATLTVFPADPAKANGMGVVVVPGGGWRILAWEHEGVDVARWLSGLGYACFLLKYRVMNTPADPERFMELAAANDGLLAQPIPAAQAPRAFKQVLDTEAFWHARDVAADDGRRAVAMVRENAARFGVRPDAVGMIGFSAGAFLVADVAMDPRAEPLAFVAPIYGGETLGKPVPADAPPLFTAVTQDDRLLFKVVEGLYADWSNADRPAEIHVFRRGAHGFGMIRQGLPVDRWTDLFADWLADLPSG